MHNLRGRQGLAHRLRSELAEDRSQGADARREREFVALDDVVKLAGCTASKADDRGFRPPGVDDAARANGRVGWIAVGPQAALERRGYRRKRSLKRVTINRYLL